MSLFGMFERRSSIENPTFPLTSSRLAEIVGGPAGSSGVTVTPTKALTMSSVFRCVSLISGVSSALPLRTYRQGTHEPVLSTLLNNPHPDLTALELWRLTYVHRCMWGNAYLQIVRDSGGKKQWLYPISPERVKVGKVGYSDANPQGKIFEVEDDAGKKRVFTSRDIFHIPGMGYDGVTGVSPLRMASQGIGLGLAAEEYGARLFGSGSLMSGLLQTEQRLEQDQAEALKARWQSKVSGLRNSHEVAILDSGAKFQSMTMPNTDAQFLESRAFQTSEIARFFGVPAFLLMDTEKSTSWGTGLEQQAIGWVTFDLHPQWLAPTEQRISKHLTDSSVDVKYSIGGLLRGDSAARASFYNVMRQVGAYSANDIREFEDMSPIPDGDTYLQPLNMAPLGSEGTQGDQPAPDGGQTT